MIDGRFYSLGLIGYPLEHSLSPRLHKAALHAMGLKGEYRLYPIPPFPQGAKASSKLLERMRSGELNGLNVTIPHKQAVKPSLDKLSPAASAIGAVNTIYRCESLLVGDNTDTTGFLADLKRLLSPIIVESIEKPMQAFVLGAGGAARAVVYTLAEKGWGVTVTARRLRQAEELARSFQRLALSGDVRAMRLDKNEFSGVEFGVDLIVNATPVGMHPNVNESPWPQGLPLPHGAVVYDLVYNPPITDFVRAGLKAGLAATTGLGMLVEQAALALELWTGLAVPRDPMRSSVQEFWIDGLSMKGSA